MSNTSEVFVGNDVYCVIPHFYVYSENNRDRDEDMESVRNFLNRRFMWNNFNSDEKRITTNFATIKFLSDDNDDDKLEYEMYTNLLDYAPLYIRSEPNALPLETWQSKLERMNMGFVKWYIDCMDKGVETKSLIAPNIAVYVDNDEAIDAVYNYITKELDKEGIIFNFKGHTRSDGVEMKSILTTAAKIIIVNEYEMDTFNMGVRCDWNYDLYQQETDCISDINIRMSKELSTIIRIVNSVMSDCYKYTSIANEISIMEDNIDHQENKVSEEKYRTRYMVLKLDGVDDKVFDSIVQDISELLNECLHDGDILDYTTMECNEL